MVVFSLLHVNIWNIHVLTPFLEHPYLRGLSQLLRDLSWPGLALEGPQKGGRMYGRMYGHTDVQIPPVFYRTSSPSGPQPKNPPQVTFLSPK